MQCISDGTLDRGQKISNYYGSMPYTLSSSIAFGKSTASIDDLNGDGVTDIIVGAPMQDSGYGAVHILFLTSEGMVKSAQKLNKDTTTVDDNSVYFSMDTVGVYGNFGWSCASLGDLNGDNVTDVAVGAPYQDDEGAVYILFLTTDGKVKSFRSNGEAEMSSLSSPYELEASDFFGRSVTSIGDLDDDGVTELAVGASYDDDGGYRTGAIYILFLETTGQLKSAQKISSTYGDFPYDLRDSDYFGSSCVSIGDLDVDGVDDLVVGANGDEGGAVFILFLNSEGKVKSAQKISSTYGNFPYAITTSDAFGGSVASAEDVDGDGVSDLVVGNYWDIDGGTEAGAVYVLFITTEGLVNSAQKISNSYGNLPFSAVDADFFGYSAAFVGDLDGDGVTDLVVGATGDDDSGSGAGAVYVLYLQAVCIPTTVPTRDPTPVPTRDPTPVPTRDPTPLPTILPTPGPTLIKCDPGFYMDTGLQCKNCSAGKASSAIGAVGESSCDTCSSGKYSSAAASACKLCPGGTYNSDQATSAENHDSVDDCADCATGKFSSEDRFSCETCSAGQYVYNVSECVNCEFGLCAPVALTDACLECPSGFATGVKGGATSCTSCDAGAFSRGLVDNCTVCLAGTYSSTSASSCTNCTAGTYADTAGSAACTACSSGRAQDQAGMHKCSQCAPGRSQRATGQSECEKCASGRYSASRGRTSCSECKGSYLSQSIPPPKIILPSLLLNSRCRGKISAP